MGREKFIVVTRHTGEAGARRRLVGRGASRLWGERLPGKGPWKGSDEGSGVSGVSPVDGFSIFNPFPAGAGWCLGTALRLPRRTATPGGPRP